MNTLFQDLRYALRSLLRAPGFTLVAALTLALGIGANSTLFSVVYVALIRHLPYPDPDRILSIGVSFNGQPDYGAEPHQFFLEWREGARSVGQLAAYQSSAANLSGDVTPERVIGSRVSASFFPLLGIRPALGRAFLAEEERAGLPATVILSDGLWRRRFAGDTAIVGRSVTMDGVPVTVAGVAPAGFDFPGRAEFWRPLQLPAPSSGVSMYVSVLGRLSPGATIAGARAELQGIAARGDGARPQYQRAGAAKLVTLHERRYGGTRPLLLMLFGTSGFVLLIACANMASLLLARASVREREFALRTALGASRARLVRLLVVESLVLAALGGAVALFIPAWGIPLLLRVGSLTALRGLAIHVDGVVIAATAAIAMVTGMVFGLAPAFAATRLQLGGALGGGGVGGAPRHARLRQGLVVGQLATALVLLVGATLLTRSLLRMTAVDPGFRSDHVLAATLSLPGAKYHDAASTNAFYAALLEQARALPGVQAAALADVLPLQGFRYSRSITLDGAPVPEDGSGQANFNNVTDDYFATVGMSVEAGRGFGRGDVKGAPAVAVVNAAFARQFSAAGSPIGHSINMNGEMVTNPTIVGVVRDVRQIGQDVDVKPEVFFSAAQSGELPEAIVVRTAGDPAQLAGALRQAVLDIDPSQPVSRIFTLSEDLARTAAPRRANAALLGVFAGIALLLAALGLYGVTAYIVAQRTREIGVRIALGAERGDVIRLVVGQGARVVVLGSVIGLLLARLLSRVLADFLFEIPTTDVATYLVAPTVLVAVALLASYVPARRAAGTDPMIALRSE
jgi:putative ABC transport system permease protein